MTILIGTMRHMWMILKITISIVCEIWTQYPLNFYFQNIGLRMEPVLSQIREVREFREKSGTFIKSTGKMKCLEEYILSNNKHNLKIAISFNKNQYKFNKNLITRNESKLLLCIQKGRKWPNNKTTGIFFLREILYVEN